jgi:hypothetical protein
MSKYREALNNITVESESSDEYRDFMMNKRYDKDYMNKMFNQFPIKSDDDFEDYDQQEFRYKFGDNIGGAEKDIPFGGFPPLYLCPTNGAPSDSSKKRGYSTHKTAVSIKDIMKKRRDTARFYK